MLGIVLTQPTWPSWSGSNFEVGAQGGLRGVWKGWRRRFANNVELVRGRSEAAHGVGGQPEMSGSNSVCVCVCVCVCVVAGVFRLFLRRKCNLFFGMKTPTSFYNNDQPEEMRALFFLFGCFWNMLATAARITKIGADYQKQKFPSVTTGRISTAPAPVVHHDGS